jgi:DNA-binding winged helix-turn-helix (wHTH) protein/TolB-like protein/Tfp pilus assembly protein PilF
MSAPERTSFRFGPFRLDPRERLLYCLEQPVPLTPKAVETLIVLVTRHGRLVTKDDILREVWPDVVVEENNLAQHISMLRRTLAQPGSEVQFIETVPKRGYRFVAPVIEEHDSPPLGAAVAPVATPARPAPSPGAAAPWAFRRVGWILAVSVGASVVVAIGFGGYLGVGRHDPPSRGEAPASNAPRRLAVLPFVNLGPADSAYLADGTVEELTSRLASIGDLGVISTTSTREYDRAGKTLRRIGADLGAAYVIEGSVRRDEGAGELVRIIPRMVRVADDVTIWTHQYVVKLSDVEGAHADMARRIGEALQADAAISVRSAETRPFADPEAYLAYLRGVSAFQQSQSDTSLQALARRELEFAVERDPQAALAWSWLSKVYSAAYDSGALRTPAIREAAVRAANRAIALAPDLPEARLARARVLLIDRDVAGALRELTLARQARPTLEGIRIEAWVRQRRGEWAQSLALFMKGFELDPAAISDLIGVHYLHRRDYVNAERYLAIARAASRPAATVPEAWLRFSDGGDLAAAREILEPALALKPPDARVRGLLARYEWFDGRYERALALIGDMEPPGAWLPANFRFPAGVAMGQVYESMGQTARAQTHFSEALKSLTASLRPDDYQAHAGIGLAAAGLRQADLAVHHGRRAVEILPASEDAVAAPVLLYVLATIHARLGQHAEAFATLDRMFDAPGFYSERWIERDPWFASMRADPAFPVHFERWKRQKGAALQAMQ